jgi:replicative DNA helicase
MLSNYENQSIAMPRADQAERVILGAVLLNNTSFYEAEERGLACDDFGLDSHQRIWFAMQELLNAGSTVDIVTLLTYLGENKMLSSVGGAPYIFSLTEGLPLRTVIKDYIQIVKNKALLRHIMIVANLAVQRAADDSTDGTVIANELGDSILEATSRTISTGHNIADLLPDAVMKFNAEASMERGGVLGAALLTPEIDRVTAGLMQEELCLLAGRPGSGKTEAGLQIAITNARRGLRVHFQSLEMRSSQLLRRMWRLIAKVPVSAMRDPRTLTPDQRRAIALAQEEVADLHIFIDETHELSCSEFRSRAVLAVKRWKADILVVDYAQLLLVPKARTIIEAAPKQAETLRHIARDYCRTLALAQIRRAPPNDLNRYPDVEDILGSSAFEQAAQVILMLHRTREEKRYTGEDFCFLGKMRELQDLRTFGIRAEKWGQFADRYEDDGFPQQKHWQENE